MENTRKYLTVVGENAESFKTYMKLGLFAIQKIVSQYAITYSENAQNMEKMQKNLVIFF
jgi:hypothetical protein